MQKRVDMNELYEKIKKAMEDKKITINEMIEKTGLKQSTIYHIMKNQENFSNAKLCNVMSILDAVKEEVEDININDNVKISYNEKTGNMSFSISSMNDKDFETLLKFLNEYHPRNPQILKEDENPPQQ